MGYESSMVYTMGTALGRAMEQSVEVAVLIDGIWLTGQVVKHDGVGVVLDGGEEHFIVKVEKITAVKVVGQVPWKSITGGGQDEAPFAPSWNEAMPMPGPRAPGE